MGPGKVHRGRRSRSRPYFFAACRIAVPEMHPVCVCVCTGVLVPLGATLTGTLVVLFTAPYTLSLSPMLCGIERTDSRLQFWGGLLESVSV